MAFYLGEVGGEMSTAWIITDMSVFKKGHFGTAARHVSHCLEVFMLVDTMAAISRNGSNTQSDRLFTHVAVT